MRLNLPSAAVFAAIQYPLINRPAGEAIRTKSLDYLVLSDTNLGVTKS